MAGQTEQIFNAVIDAIDHGHLNPGDVIGIDWTMRLAGYGAKRAALSV